MSRIKIVANILFCFNLQAGSSFYQLSFAPVVPEKIVGLIEEFEGNVTSFNKELEKRGTKFFGGMSLKLDYIVVDVLKCNFKLIINR